MRNLWWVVFGVACGPTGAVVPRPTEAVAGSASAAAVVDACASAAVPLDVRRAPAEVHEGAVTLRLRLLSVADPVIAAEMAALGASLRARLVSEAERCTKEAEVLERCRQVDDGGTELPAECVETMPSCEYGAQCTLSENDGRVFVARCEMVEGDPYARKVRDLSFLRGDDGYVAVEGAELERTRACAMVAASWGPPVTRGDCEVLAEGAPVTVVERPLDRSNGRSTLSGKTVHVADVPALDAELMQAVTNLWTYASAYHTAEVDCRRRGAKCDFGYTCNVTRNDGRLLSVRCHYSDVIVNATASSRAYTYFRDETLGWRPFTARELFLRAELVDDDPAFGLRDDPMLVDTVVDWDDPHAFSIDGTHLHLLGLRFKPSEPDPSATFAELRDQLACPFYAWLNRGELLRTSPR